MEQLECSYTADGKQFDSFSKVKHLPYNQAIPFLSIYIKKN